MKTYKAIGFDWGGVLNGRPGKYFAQAISDKLGVPIKVYQTAYFHHNQKINRGEITWQQLWQAVAAELGHGDEPELVNYILRTSQEANADNLNQDVLQLVDTLRTNGYKVGLLSNNTADKAALMRQHGLDKHFNAFDISVETGLVKPDPQAFRHLADGLGVELSELVFIDDSPKSLSTATETGFTPVLFDTYNQLLQDLAALGVAITKQ